MSLAEKCEQCRKPLADLSGPEIMDGHGRVYHFACWIRTVDVHGEDDPPRAERSQA